MSVKIRRYRNTDGWEIDISLRLANGRRYRERVKAPVASKSGALRWGQDRERHLVQHGPEQQPAQKEEVPKLKEFADRFIEGYAVANRQKPSGIAAKKMILRVHLLPCLGHRRLDAITNEDVQRLKRSLEAKATKTVNNVLTVLSVILKIAIEWGEIATMPCTVKLLPISKGPAEFYDFTEYERVLEVGRQHDWRTELIVLLGGEAGLRCGEMIALEWSDIDSGVGQLTVRRSDWNGIVTAPKTGRVRYVPMTTRLTAALRVHRHLRSTRVLCQNDGTPLTRQMVQNRMRLAAKRASVRQGVHILRHTFCSHLAMRGAPVSAIQQLAGHTELTMTQRYVHLSPSSLHTAIGLLNSPTVPSSRGEIMETVARDAGKR